MGLEYVEIAVEVVIPDGDAHPGLFGAVGAVGEPPLCTLLDEGRIVSVPEEEAWGGIGRDVDVRPAVAAEIGGDRSHPINARRLRDSAIERYVPKGAVALVAI